MKNFLVDDVTITLTQKNDKGIPYTVIYIKSNDLNSKGEPFDCVYICDGYDDIASSIGKAYSKYNRSKNDYLRYNR